MASIYLWLLRISLKEHKNGKYYILPNIFSLATRENGLNEETEALGDFQI